MAFTSSIWPAYPPEAVVIGDRIALHEQPDSEATVLEDIHAGLVVGLVSETGDWMLVQLPNGVRGWVTSADMGII
jgi:SH3-like domain-containing protein